MTLQPFLSGLLIGFLGSLHCAGMCGPLMFLLPAEKSWKSMLSNQSIYHLGRTTTYVLLGLTVGFFFVYIDVRSMEQTFSLVLGTLFLSLWLIEFFAKRKAKPSVFQQFIERSYARIMKGNAHWRWFLGGMVNGLLPCGLVYGALLTSLSTQSQMGAVVFMAGFGVATAPALISVVFAKNWIQKIFGKAVNKLLPFWLLIMAIFFLLRGANLGIPFLSPHFDFNKEKTEEASCCH